MDRGLVGQNGQFVVVPVMAVLDQGQDHAVTQYHCVMVISVEAKTKK